MTNNNEPFISFGSSTLFRPFYHRITMPCVDIEQFEYYIVGHMVNFAWLNLIVGRKYFVN